MFKKNGFLFLVIMLCLVSLTSCFVVINKKGEGPKKSPTETSKETESVIERVPAMTDVLAEGKAEAEKALEGLFEGKDLAGESISIIIADSTNMNIYPEQESSYNTALQFQRELISEKLNCTVYVYNISYNTFISDVQAAMNTGIYYSDVICIPQRCVGELCRLGLIADLYSLYGDVFVEDCYDLDAKAQGEGGNRLYGIAGDASVTPGAYGCVYFNKTVSDSFGITEQIYEAAENGSFTIDKMLEFKTLCTSEEGTVAAVASSSNDMLIESLFGATGMNYFTSSLEGVPSAAENGERMDTFINKLRALVGDTANCICAENAYEIFEQGQALFYIDTLEKAATLKNSYGIVPLPKLDINQTEYHTFANGYAYVFAVLNSNNRSPYAVDLIRAFNETAAVLNDAWTRDILDYALRDSKSYNMLKLILQNPNYDFAYFYGEAYESVASSSYDALKRAVLENADYKSLVAAQSVKFKNTVESIFG